MTRTACSPGEHHARRNFRLGDYAQMVRDGETKFSVSEAARVMGVSRMHVHRTMSLASVSDEEFETILADEKLGRTLTAISDEVKRRTGRAREHVKRCPHCDGALRIRNR